jgi:hypothetical protein
MKALYIFLAATLVASSSAVFQSNDRIAFVYEVVRHGARAPLMNEPPGYF